MDNNEAAVELASKLKDKPDGEINYTSNTLGKFGHDLGRMVFRYPYLAPMEQLLRPFFVQVTKAQIQRLKERQRNAPYFLKGYMLYTLDGLREREKYDAINSLKEAYPELDDRQAHVIYLFWKEGVRIDELEQKIAPRLSIHSEYPENAALTITNKKGNDRLYIERLRDYLSEYLEGDK